MEEKRRMTNEQLEAALGKHRALSVVFKILTCITGLGTILLFSGDMIPAAIVCLVVTFVFGYQMGRHATAVKTLLSENIVSGVLHEVFEDAAYEPFRCIPSGLVVEAGMVFPFAYDSVRGSDHIKGVYKGLQVELSDIELCHVESVYNEERDGWDEETETLFKGQWLVCDFGRPLSGEVRLSANTKALRRQLGGGVIEMEDPVFNGRFLVTAESAQDAYYLLTPHIMETLLAAAERSGGEVYMAFLRGGKLHVAVRTGRDFLELGKSKTDVERLRQKFLGELRWFTSIIDALRLEDTLYRRA